MSARTRRIAAAFAKLNLMALSTHAGGAANKAGLFYESLWGVRCMVDVLNGKAASIQIETPGDDGAEFCLQRGTVREHWQIKRQVTGQGTWSLQKLKGVLGFFFEKFRIGESSVFASVSDAPELRMLTENAQATKKAGEGLDYFKQHFLGKKRSAQLEALQNIVGAVSEEEMFNFLCTITVHGGREATLKPEFGFRLFTMFQGHRQTTMAVLRDLFLRSAHETLTAADIERYLQTSGIAKRRGGAPDANERILELTRTYVAGQRAKLIRNTPIQRGVAADVVKRIQSSTSSLDIFITSAAGGGKSACLCQIVEGLQSAGLPVLAFRLDRVEPVPTVILLGEKLGLGESPALVLSEAFADQPVVLVIDQLDCVSTTSGRHSGFFDTIAALRAEVLGLRLRQYIHLVFACRKFDFEHDHRLKQIASSDQPLIELGEFSLEEVTAVLQQEGGDASRLTPRQQAMLRLPQNLSLFVAAGLARTENRFSTPKELCDAYWNEKRKAVSAQQPEFSGHWMPVIQCLARTMSDRQELSVPESVMDAYPPEFLDRMTSEGVLSRSGNRYGFGHETFFDYCFARTQPNGGRDFIEFLKADTQHLFRRAQLRQVLAFLRDEDFDAYLISISNLLRSKCIRPHLQLLVVDLLAAHPDARDEELTVLMLWIEPEIARRQKATENSVSLVPQFEKFSARICDRFFSSRTLFIVADRMGFISKWLHSGESWLQDTMTLYLRSQTEQHAERVAELLEPFVGNAEWSTRLRYMMEGRNLEKSRRFFELFLRLLSDGTLDDAKDRFATNGTFWSMVYGLAERRPIWCAELAARWLDRQTGMSTYGENSEDEPHSSFNDAFGIDDLFKSARGNPKAFLQYVLPAVLRAAEAFAFRVDEEEFPRDRLWPARFRSEHTRMLEAFLEAIDTALELHGQESPDGLRTFVDQLYSVKLYTANHLLMTSYLSNPVTFSNEVMDLLADEPERLSCGYFDNPYWHTRRVIEECSPHCTDETFQRIEVAVLDFVPPYERSKKGLRLRGRAAYNLSSSLDEGRLSIRGRKQIAEWREKFKEPDHPSIGIRSCIVGPPIAEESATHMTDDQWLGAIAKYNTEEITWDFDHPEKGGALQLARMLQKFTTEQPERFAELAFRLPDNSHPYYFSHMLRGLKEASISHDQKLAVARRLFNIDHYDCLCSTLDMLASYTKTELPDDAVQFIERAAAYPDPEAELWDSDTPYYGGDILTYGINCVRGRVAETICSLVFADAAYLSVFTTTIEKLVADPRLAVRACVGSTIIAVAKHDTPMALRLSTTLMDADDRLLATQYIREFIQHSLHEHFEHFAPVIKRMLCSVHEKVKETGGILACLARLYHSKADTLSEAALAGDEHCRLGACEVAKSNLLQHENRTWCETALIQLFSDESKKVRQMAAGCFRELGNLPDTLLTDFETLIHRFLSSQAFVDEPTHLLYALKESRHRLPESVLDVCEIFIARCSDAARDLSTSRSVDEMTVGKLVFSAYAQLQSHATQTRALDAIDRMSIEGLNSANTHLSEFER